MTCFRCQSITVCLHNSLCKYNIYFDFNYDAGARNHMKTVHTRTWQHAVFHQSKEPPPFYPDEFKIWADAILQHIGMTQNTLLHKTVEMYI